MPNPFVLGFCIAIRNAEIENDPLRSRRTVLENFIAYKRTFQRSLAIGLLMIDPPDVDCRSLKRGDVR